MNKTAEVKVKKELEGSKASQIVALFSLDQVDNSVKLLVACGETLSSDARAAHRQWLDIRARALIASKLSTIYENQLGKSNSCYGKAKLWAELAARWIISGNDTVDHMHRARESILQMLRAHPPTAETVLKTFQKIYNHTRKNVKKGNVPIAKLAPYISELPVRQDQVTVQALKFASASAHAIKWSDYLLLTDDVKRQLDIIKTMPNVVIIFNKLTFQLREDWQQQWTNAQSSQILAFYEMIYKAHTAEQCNSYIEALVGVSYSICKGPNLIDKWLISQLRRIQKKFPDLKIKDSVSIEDLNTFISAYLKSDIPINDVYKFLRSIYSSLNKRTRKAVNLIIEQAAIHKYSHAIEFGLLNENTKYRCIPYLISNLPRIQWKKIAQIAVDLQYDPCHVIVKAQTIPREFIDLANFGKFGMSIFREKVKTNFEGFIHDGILTKKEILELIERARLIAAVDESEEFVLLDGLMVTPVLANFHIVFLEDRIFTCNSNSNINSVRRLKQGKEVVTSEQRSEALKATSTLIGYSEDSEQQNTNSVISMQVDEKEIQLESYSLEVNSMHADEEQYSDSAIIMQQDEEVELLELQSDALDEEEGTDQQDTNSISSLQQKVEIAQEGELLDTREVFREKHEDIHQRNINTLINLQQEIHNVLQDEQKEVLEEFCKQERAVLLERYKNIENTWQQEERITPEDELNDVLEQFQRQIDGIQLSNVNSATSLHQEYEDTEFQRIQKDIEQDLDKESQDSEQSELNNSLEQFSQSQNKNIEQLSFNQENNLVEEEEGMVNNGLDEISRCAEELEEVEHNISNKFSLQQNVLIAQQSVLEGEGIQQCSTNSAISLDLEKGTNQQDEQSGLLVQPVLEGDGIQQHNTDGAISLELDEETNQQDELIDSIDEIGKYLKEQVEQILQINCDNANTMLQYDEKVVLNQQNDVIEQSEDKPREILDKEGSNVEKVSRVELKQRNAFEQGNEDKEGGIEQCNPNSAITMLIDDHVARDEQKDDLGQFGDQRKVIVDVQQTNVSIVEAITDRIAFEQKSLPEAVRKLTDIGKEISKTQLPLLYARAMAVHQDIKAARVICKYLNIVGKRSVFHPFVKKDRKRPRPSRFRPIPVELRNAAAVFGVQLPDDPVENCLNANELTKAPRAVVKELLPDEGEEEESDDEKDELTQCTEDGL